MRRSHSINVHSVIVNDTSNKRNDWMRLKWMWRISIITHVIDDGGREYTFKPTKKEEVWKGATAKASWMENIVNIWT